MEHSATKDRTGTRIARKLYETDYKVVALQPYSSVVHANAKVPEKFLHKTKLSREGKFDLTEK